MCSMKLSLTSDTGVQMCFNSLFQNQRPLFLVPLVPEEHLGPPCEDQQNGKRTLPSIATNIEYLPNPSGLTSSIHALIFK